MKIDYICIACNRNDLFWTKPSVASIRYFYPDIKITLVKDFTNGRLSTREMEEAFGVDAWEIPKKKCGFCSKLEVMLRPQRERFF